MSGIRAKDTKPEVVIRKALHARGFRFRLHDSELPGRPDIVLRRYRSVVFVHGCFWHGHDCALFRLPQTRQVFWGAKIERNRMNDLKHLSMLLSAGWRVAIVWECSLRGRNARIDAVSSQLSDWLRGTSVQTEIRG